MPIIEVNHLTKGYRLGAMQGLKQKLLNTGARLTGKKWKSAPSSRHWTTSAFPSSRAKWSASSATTAPERYSWVVAVSIADWNKGTPHWATASIALTSSRRVLVVGGAGYIGSHRVNHLPRWGCDVVAFGNHSKGYRTPVQVEREWQGA